MRLPGVDSLRLSGPERDELLNEELDRIRVACDRPRVRFAAESVGTGVALYAIDIRLLRKKGFRFRLTISDLGLSHREQIVG